MQKHVFFLGFALLWAACGKGSVKPITYAGNAQRLYESGMRSYQKGNYTDATASFQTVKRRFPYSKWAILAELRIADSSFGREAYLEAVDAYKLFMKFHPTNENVPYAQYQIAHAHYKLGPDDWFLLPPAYEKDMQAVVDALTEVKKFMKNYPGSGLRPKAQELLRKCERKLGDLELYVARFYLDRDKLAAALGRLEYLLSSYPTLAADEEVLYLLGRTYASMGRHAQATTVYQKLMTEKPKSKYGKKVTAYLTQRRSASATPSPAPKK